MADVKSKQKEEQVRQRIVGMANQAMDKIDEYFRGVTDDSEKANIAMRLLSQSTKIINMNQQRIATERSHILKLLPFIDDASRAEYIRLTNPQVSPLLLKRPGQSTIHPEEAIAEANDEMLALKERIELLAEDNRMMREKLLAPEFHAIEHEQQRKAMDT